MSELRERRRAATLRRFRTIECRGGRGSAENAPTAPPKGQRSSKIFDNFFFFYSFGRKKAPAAPASGLRQGLSAPNRPRNRLTLISRFPPRPKIVRKKKERYAEGEDGQDPGEGER